MLREWTRIELIQTETVDAGRAKKCYLEKVFDQKETAIYILGSSAMLRCCPKAGALLGQAGGGGRGGHGGTVKSE